MKSLMEKVTKRCVLQAVPGIKRAMLKKRDDGQTSKTYLIVEGVNLMVRWHCCSYGPQLWNSLPFHIRHFTSSESFQSNFKSFFFF
jgi:hypothetical protein